MWDDLWRMVIWWHDFLLYVAFRQFMNYYNVEGIQFGIMLSRFYVDCKKGQITTTSKPYLTRVLGRIILVRSYLSSVLIPFCHPILPWTNLGINFQVKMNPRFWGFLRTAARVAKNAGTKLVVWFCICTPARSCKSFFSTGSLLPFFSPLLWLPALTFYWVPLMTNEL